MRGRAGWTKRPKWLRLPPIDLPTTDLPPPSSLSPALPFYTKKKHPELQSFFPEEENVTYLVRQESRQQSLCAPETAAPLRWLRWVLLLWPTGARVGLRGRAETAAARRGLLATSRASEDAARVPPVRDPPAPSFPSSPSSYFSISSHSAPSTLFISC